MAYPGAYFGEILRSQFRSVQQSSIAQRPDVGDTFFMRMCFELLRDAAGQTNQPYNRSVQQLNMHGRGLGWKIQQRGASIGFTGTKASHAP